jgi:hypothetical protein
LENINKIKHFARFSGKLCILLVFIRLHGFNSFAQTQYEFWPELNCFIKLNEQFRFYLVSAYAEGKESETKTMDLAANIDISVKPIFGKRHRLEDWQRTRFLWLRFGYDYISKQVSGTKSTPENRGMINIFAKGHLPADIWLESRTRADLRWIGGDYSTRYRLRLEATREFTVFRHTVVPYLNCEAFYDTRYSGWSRLLIMGGAEFTVSNHFRFELYLAPQIDYLPSKTNLLAFGVVAKLYY